MKDTASIIDFIPLQPTVDTCKVNVTDTTIVSVTHFPTDNQPNGWLQLLLPAVVALIVVFLEKWVAKIFECRKERDKRKRYRNTVLDWIKNITTSEKSFNQTVKCLSTSISSSDDMQPVAYAMPLVLHDSLKDMSVEKMTDAFLSDFKKDKEERSKKVFAIISGITFLKKINEKVIQSYETYNRKSFDLCQEWNTTYESFLDNYNAMQVPNQYQQIVQEWQMELVKKPGSRKVHLDFLEKVLLIANKSKDYKTLSLINRLRRTVLQSEKNIIGFADNFKGMSNSISLTIDSLLESEQYLRKDKRS